MLLSRIITFVFIPDHQFGIRQQHIIIETVQNSEYHKSIVGRGKLLFISFRRYNLGISVSVRWVTLRGVCRQTFFSQLKSLQVVTGGCLGVDSQSLRTNYCRLTTSPRGVFICPIFFKVTSWMVNARVKPLYRSPPKENNLSKR